MRRVITLLLGLVLGACSSIQYNLPAVTSNASGDYLPGKFIWHDLISDDPEGSKAFYEGLFGWKFRSLELIGADYWVISLHGKPIAGMVSQADLAADKDISQWISVMAVRDQDAAAALVSSSGGQVLRAPVSIGDRGTIAVFADAQGAHFATLTTPSGDPEDHEGLPAEGAFLWHELWTSDVAGAARLYAQLGDLSTRKVTAQSVNGDPIEFRMLRGAGKVRGGIRSLPEPAMPSLWMPYLRVTSEARLEVLLAKVLELGGQVLVPKVERSAGGYVAIIADPSGAPIALQTWRDDQTLLEDV